MDPVSSTQGTEESAQLAEVFTSSFLVYACVVGSFIIQHKGAELLRKDVLRAVPLCHLLSSPGAPGNTLSGESDRVKGGQEQKRRSRMWRVRAGEAGVSSTGRWDVGLAARAQLWPGSATAAAFACCRGLPRASWASAHPAAPHATASCSFSSGLSLP